MTFDDTLRDGSQFWVNSQIPCYENVSFSLLLVMFQYKGQILKRILACVTSSTPCILSWKHKYQLTSVTFTLAFPFIPGLF